MGNIYTEGFALIVGVGADLPNTVDDAEGLANLLKDTSRCAYPEHQVNLLVSQQATRDNMLAGLDQLAQKATPDATVIVYFSGHGYRVKSSLGESYYLMPFGYNTSELYKTAISGQEFTQKLRAIPAKKVLILLDCCHAGGVGDAKTPGLELEKSPLPPEAQQLLAEGQGRVLIASSREDELSYAGKPYSAFTLALLEALCGQGVAKKDGYVRVADIALYTREWVPQRTKNLQHPILDYEKADNFVVAYYASGDSEPKRLPFEAESIEVERKIEQQPQPQVMFNQEGQNVKNQNNIGGNVGSIQNS
ncbi:MAG: caspase family protein [Cyanobacteria bacterium J06592_8]